MTMQGPRLPAETSARRQHEAGSIVLGWLGRVVITLTILGVATFEVLSIVVAHVSIEDTGRTAADQALSTYQDSHNKYQAFLAADAYATDNGAELVKRTFTISDEAVSFDLKKTAPTLLLYRFGPTEHLAEVRTTIYEQPIVDGGVVP
jgi:hypothetical protein